MENFIPPEEAGLQFSAEDPSDEADQLQLKAAIEQILEKTFEDNNDKPMDQPCLGNSLFKDSQDQGKSVTLGSGESSFCCTTETISGQEDIKEGLLNRSQNSFEAFDGSEVITTADSSTSQLNGKTKSSDHIPSKTSAIEDKQPNDGEISKVGKRSPRKSKDKALLNRESEIIRKKKELLKADDRLKLPLKKRGRPRVLSRSPSAPAVTTQSTAECADIKENDGCEFFLPDGWLFYAHKRQSGPNVGKFDLYYYTPLPKREKLRSRLEIIAWMKKKKVNLNIDNFFCFNYDMIESLINKGILKYISERCVIAASTEKVFFEEGRHYSIDKSRHYPIDKSRAKQQPVETKKAPKPKKKRRGQKKGATLSKSEISVKSYVSRRQTSPVKPQLLPMKLSSDSSSVDCDEDYVSGKFPIDSEPLSSFPNFDDCEEHCVKIRKKPKIFRSPYFSMNDGLPEKPLSIAALCRDRNDKDAPPRSPFNLIQEDLFHNPWQLLVSTIFLNCTSGKLAIPLAMEFLSRWSTPQEVCRANIHDILDVVEPVGFGRTRAVQLIRFSHEFLTKDWKYPDELHGIGKYGNDSYRIFCSKNAWKKVDTDDPLLMMYLNWRRATEHLRKKFLNSPAVVGTIDPDEVLSQSSKSMEVLSCGDREPEISLKRKSSPESSPVSKRGRKLKRTI